jgi:hypothetical protein
MFTKKIFGCADALLGDGETVGSGPPPGRAPGGTKPRICASAGRPGRAPRGRAHVARHHGHTPTRAMPLWPYPARALPLGPSKIETLWRVGRWGRMKRPAARACVARAWRAEWGGARGPGGAHTALHTAACAAAPAVPKQDLLWRNPKARLSKSRGAFAPCAHRAGLRRSGPGRAGSAPSAAPTPTAAAATLSLASSAPPPTRRSPSRCPARHRASAGGGGIPAGRPRGSLGAAAHARHTRAQADGRRNPEPVVVARNGPGPLAGLAGPCEAGRIERRLWGAGHRPTPNQPRPTPRAECALCYGSSVTVGGCGAGGGSTRVWWRGGRRPWCCRWRRGPSTGGRTSRS